MCLMFRKYFPTQDHKDTLLLFLKFYSFSFYIYIYDLAQNNFCVLYEVGLKARFFPNGYTIVPVSVLKKSCLPTELPSSDLDV